MDTVSIHFPLTQIESFCRRNHILRFALFGSAIREDFSPSSDIDILVQFDADHTPGFDFFLMEAELSQVFGRKVDLQTEKFLSPDITRSVQAELVTLYEQA